MTPARYTACVLAIAALFIGLAWTFADTMGMAFLESGYPVVVAKRALIDRCQAGELVVLGDSRGEASIIPAKLPIPSANLAIGAIGPVADYFIARNLLKCPHPPHYVLITNSIIGYQMLGQGLWQRAAKFGLVTYDDLRQVADAAASLHDPSVENISTNDGLTGRVRDFVYSFGFPTIFVSSAVDARLLGRYASNLRVLDAVSRSRGHVVYPDGPGGAIVGADAKIDHFDPEPVEKYYFDATLAMLSRAGIRTIVLPIPVADATRAALRPEVVQGVIRYVAQQTQGVPNVTDAFTTVEGWPDRMFVDGSHMNAAGATTFSDRLAGCVRTWLQDPDAACPMTPPE